MNILTILAHDKKNSLNHHLFENTVRHLQANGHQVTSIDLYQHHAELPFYLQATQENSTTTKTFDDYPFVQTIKQQFLEADAVVLVFPVYCFSCPAILKAWIDILTRFAYTQQQGVYPKPLHHIKAMLIVTTMGMPWIAKVLWAGNCIKKYFKKVFSFIGIKNIQFYEITSVEKINTKNIHQVIATLHKKLDAISLSK